jgi:hypothetical protein
LQNSRVPFTPAPHKVRFFQRTIRILISFLEKRRWKSLVKVSPMMTDCTALAVGVRLLVPSGSADRERRREEQKMRFSSAET